MSSATNNQRGRMEEEFQRRMLDAEASPSADLWARIDHQLTVQENGQYKRGMLFYRQLAAACVTILIVAGGMAAFYFKGMEPAPIAQFKPQQEQRAAEVLASVATQVEESAPLETDAAIAAAMQEALQPQEQQIARVAVSKPSIEKKIENSAADLGGLNFASTNNTTAGKASLSLAIEQGLEVSEAAASEPGAWHKVSISKYASSFGERELRQARKSMLSMFPSARQALLSAPATSGFTATSRAFAATNPKEADTGFGEVAETVMSRVKELQAEQEVMLQQLKTDKAIASATGKSGQDQGNSSGKWSVGMAYAPSYFEQNIGIPAQMMGTAANFRGFAPPTAMQQSSMMMDEAREEYEQEIEPGFSFGVEVKTGFKVGKKWRLLGGLGFTQNTARSKSSFIIQQFWNKPESDEKVSPGPTTIFLPSLKSNFASDSLNVAKTDEFDVHYRYRYLTVPVGTQYEGKLGKDWFWFAGGGVAANILLQTSILASASDVRDVDYDLQDENSPFRKLQWSGNVTAGVGKRLTNSMSVTVGPEFRGYFDTILSSPETARAPQGRPYTMGLNMAVNYDLGPGRK